MNKQELIERIEGLKNIFGNKCEYVKIDFITKLVSELDEPEAGQTDEAPRYVKNILARLRELPLHDREVWLKAIMGEFEQDFSHAKWREGYEQGKFEGEWVGEQLKDADKIRRELNKVKVPQFVADWVEESKQSCKNVAEFFRYKYPNIEFVKYFSDKGNIDLVARAWLDGYEVEKETKYRVKLKNINDYLNETETGFHFYNNWKNNKKFTRKELEEAGFNWVFNCPGIEIEEVE